MTIASAAVSRSPAASRASRAPRGPLLLPPRRGSGPSRSGRASVAERGRQPARGRVRYRRSGRHAEDIETGGAVAGLAKRRSRPGLELTCVLAGRARELEGAEVVVGEHVGAVFGALDVEGLDPSGGKAMLLRALCAGYLSVRDVADEDVPERVLRLAGHRGAPLAADELLPLEREQLLGLPAWKSGKTRQRACPERPADDGGVLQERLFPSREGVEAGGDDSLDRLGQGRSSLVAAAAPACPAERRSMSIRAYSPA